jgi:hypothetical protein
MIFSEIEPMRSQKIMLLTAELKELVSKKGK